MGEREKREINDETAFVVEKKKRQQRQQPRGKALLESCGMDMNLKGRAS